MQNDELDPNFEDKLKSIESKIDEVKDHQTVGKKHKKKEKDGKQIAEAMISEMLAGVAFGVIVGLLIDNYFHTKPFFLITLVILGLAGSIYNIYKATLK